MEFIEVNHKVVRRLPRWSEKKQEEDTGQHVFIIGCKGIPASYGGFETFAEKLTEHRKSEEIHYHVARMAEDTLHYEYNGAECFDVKSPQIGAARAIWYDVAALHASILWCRRNHGIKHPIFYVLACRIGPFIGYFKKEIQKIGGIFYLNPDGHEWKRSKWNWFVRRYWKISEKWMVKQADLVICDSMHIRSYIQKQYEEYHPRTEFLYYGSDIPFTESEEKRESRRKYAQWLREKEVTAGEYYLSVSRFVPENNFECMIREFMVSDTKRDFVIITTHDKRFFHTLEKRLQFSKDTRIRFVGTVYDMELLRQIRKNAYAYLHGHEVGGTNPSLLESLGTTELNLLLDVGFNREVAQTGALYWTKTRGNLAALIQSAEAMCKEEIHAIGKQAKIRIRESYQWEDIVEKYEALFLNCGAETT